MSAPLSYLSGLRMRSDIILLLSSAETSRMSFVEGFCRLFSGTRSNVRCIAEALKSFLEWFVLGFLSTETETVVGSLSGESLSLVMGLSCR